MSTPRKFNLPDFQDIADGTFTHWLLRITDWLGNSDFANRAIRPRILRFFGMQLGRGCIICPGLESRRLKDKVSIGPRTFINKNCLFDATEAIYIGKQCLIGHRVTLITSNHALTVNERGVRPISNCKPITIEDFVWVGANATILPGVRVGQGAIVAAGAVVTKDVLPHTVVAGIPASVIRKLENSEIINEIAKISNPCQ